MFVGKRSPSITSCTPILFSNQSKTKTTILNFSVKEASERGLLGVAVASKNMVDPDIATTVNK
jgi:hypothetical protein